MNLVFVTDAREQGVAEDAIHDIQKRVEHQSCLAIGERLLNIVWRKLVLVADSEFAWGQTPTGVLSPSLGTWSKSMNSFHVADS